jgi:Kef-type K+ transport system membrane component KefB
LHLHPAHGVVDGGAVPYWPFALFVGASLSLTAFPVLARILQQTRRAGTELGALVLSAAAIDDLVGWTALAVALVALASGGAWEYVRIAAESALLVAAVVLVVRPLLRRALATPSAAREALVVPLALGGAFATEAIGVHAVFGAFLVGTAMPRPGPAELRRHLAGTVALLAPIYFVISGMTVDIPGLRGSDVTDLALILAAACTGKFLGAFGGARAARTNVRDAITIGILMNTRGLIEIVLLTVGRDRGLIDDRLFTLLALMAIVTTLLTAPLLRLAGPPARDRPTVAAL